MGPDKCYGTQLGQGWRAPGRQHLGNPRSNHDLVWNAIQEDSERPVPMISLLLCKCKNTQLSGFSMWDGKGDCQCWRTAARRELQLQRLLKISLYCFICHCRVGLLSVAITQIHVHANACVMIIDNSHHNDPDCTSRSLSHTVGYGRPLSQTVGYYRREVRNTCGAPTDLSRTFGITRNDWKPMKLAQFEYLAILASFWADFEHYFWDFGDLSIIFDILKTPTPLARNSSISKARNYFWVK